VNRQLPLDSKLSLDRWAEVIDGCVTASETSPMPPAAITSLGPVDLPEPLRLERIDPARNMRRYYTLSIEMTLFDEVACMRGFGRIGARGGRIMIGLFESRAEAEAELHRLLRAKQTRGYKLTRRSGS
jgi:predicted DNA-binding WGR domain protein